MPLRQCIGCGEMKSKKEMIRVLKTADDTIEIDATGRRNGRGAYLCPSMDCWKKAVKSKGLERSLKMAIPKEVYEALEKEINERRLAALLSGEYDANNAILTFHAGAGGTEAQDWTEMLYRMYTRWAERHGYTYQLMDYEAGDEAGIKSATILIEGENAYGYLKSENGVHRLVRVSPFDANARRQTSFAALEVMPELDDDSEIEIRPEDIEMQACRSSGAGGQHINKTSSAVRLIHKPTGIVVSSQQERSQFQNKDNCMKQLRAKLIELKIQQHAEKISDIKGVQMKIEWGSQIRSYVFMPYQLVKDTRTGYETSQIDNVMDGDLDGFLNAYLTQLATGELKK